MDNTYAHYKTNDELVALLAEQVRSYRLKLNITQEQLAQHAEVAIGSLKKFESGGDIRLSTFVALLRALDQLEGLLQLLPDPDEPSPLALVEKRQERQRARPKKILQ